MYQVNSDKLSQFENQIDNPNRKVSYKFTLKGAVLETNQIMDNPTITYDCGLEQYSVGCALVTQLQMSVKSDVLIIPNDKIAIQVGLDIYNEVTQQWETIYTPLGVFYVDTIEEKGIKKSIKAYDGMFKLNKGYFPTSKHTTTQAIANDIATSNGYKIKGISNVSINNEQLEGKTCLEMLSLVASAIGGHVRISRDGSTIEFIEPTNYGETYDESDYTTPTIDDTTSYNITKLRVNYSDQVTNDEGTVTDEGYYEVGSGTDANTLAISNPLLKGQKSQAQIILDKVKRLNGYKRFDTSMPLADFRLEPMDIITYIKGEKECIVPILYMKMTLSYKGVSIETQSPTVAETKSEFSFKGTLSQKVENIYTDIIQVKQLTANKVTTDELEATVAKIEQLYVTKVDADEIYANKAEIGDLVAGSIVVEDLKAQVAQVESLVANKANITDLNAINATINNLKADVAEIDDLISNSIISGIIQSGSISSDLLNIKNGFIKDAMIDSVTASKINSGVINTNNVTIQSNNGNMLLQGNLLQFKDKNNKVRIQIGQDTTGNYTFTLYDATGQGVLINEKGIQSSNAIKDGLIVDSKVSSNANISGSKLNINSVYDEMNKDGSKTLKASKVLLDEQNQTLDVSFKEMTTKQDELEDTMSTTITDLSVEKGKISQLIQDTTITTSGGTTKLKDAYNSTKSTVDSHTTQIGKMQTTINANTGEITSTKNDVATIKADLNEIELGLSSVEKNIGDNYYTKSQTDSQIKATKDSINLGISQTYETKTNVSSKVSSTLTSAKQYADTKKSEAISTASSDATSKANNALSSAKSYTDTAKNDLNTAIGKKANSADVYTKTEVYTKSQTDSQIKATKDAINLNVSQTYETKTNVQTQINNIQVGGTNLVQNSDFSNGTSKWSSVSPWGIHSTTTYGGKKVCYISRSGLTSDSWAELKSNNISCKQGEMYTMSVDIKTSGLIANTDTATLFIWSYDTNGGNRKDVGSYALPTSTDWVRYKCAGTIPSGSTIVRACITVKRNGTVYATNFKLEKGNKATDWSPCPSDVNGSITSAITESKNYADSQIKIAKDAINLGVSNTYETKTNVTSKVNSAISTASSDATTKANNALSSAKSYADTKKTEAINSANNTLNTTIANYYTKSQTDSQINVAKNAITQSVSNTYETKTNVQNKIDAIQVGGRNLWLRTKEYKANVDSIWVDNNDGIRVTNAPHTTINGFGVQRIASAWTDISQRVPIEPNTQYTLSAYIKWESAVGTLMFYDKASPQSNTNVTSQVGTSNYKRVSVTFNSNTGTVSTCRFECTTNTPYLIYGLKLEKGNKATDWSPAPEDMETTVSNLTQRVTTAESKITDTAITNTVKKNFYTKTETENAITSKGYATQSQVQQTADNIQFKFTQSGGYNLVRNGNPKPHNYRNWWVSGNANWYSGRAADIGVQTTDTNEAYAGSATFKVQPGKAYSFNCWLMAESNTKGTDVYFIGSANDDGAYTEVHHLFTSGACGWTHVKKTFTTGSNINYGFIRIDNNGRKDTSTGNNTVVFFSEVLLVQGSEYYPQWSPNPNEVYDGIIEMDKDGIKVSTSNGGWTDFTSAGMNVYNKSSMLSLGTRNGGLTYHNSKGYLGFTSESNISSYNVSGVTISTANAGSYITLGTSTTTDPFGGFTSRPALSIAKEDIGDANTSFYHQGVNLHTTLNVNTKPIKQVGTMYYGINGMTRTYESTTGNLCLLGDNGVVLGYYQGNDIVTKFKIIEGSSASESYIDTYAHWRFHGWSLTDVANLSIKNNIKMETTATIQFNSTATYPSLIWEASNRLKLYGNDGIDFGYRNGSSNMPIFRLHEGADTAYRIESFSHWNFNNWNLENVGILKPQRLQLPSTYGSNWIGLGTGDGNDYTTYNVKFRTHNGLAFTDNSDSATVIVQGRQGRIMGKNAYYVNCSRSLKSDIRSVISEDDVTTFVAKEEETLDTNISAETVCDFLDAIDVKTYVTDFKQEGATQECFDIEKGNSLTLGYIADDIAEHPMFKYVGEKTNDGLYAINSNSLTTTLIVGYQQEKRKREQLEQRLLELERLLKGDK